MSKKIFLFVLGILVAATFIIIGIIFVNKQQIPTANTSMQANATRTSPTQAPSYTIADMANAPQAASAMAHGAVIRETANANPTMQRFTIKSPLDGSSREIFSLHESGITFEKITDQNWSPSNRFLYVYIDYPDRRDVIFIKTDGRFNNGNYYLHSTGLYPTMDVQNAKWIDDQTLVLETTDIKTKQSQKYLVSFDDDMGLVTPEAK